MDINLKVDSEFAEENTTMDYFNQLYQVKRIETNVAIMDWAMSMGMFLFKLYRYVSYNNQDEEDDEYAGMPDIATRNFG